MNSIDVDISWKGYQEFPDLTLICPKCSQDYNSKSQSSKRSHCSWTPKHCSSVVSINASHNSLHTIQDGILESFHSLSELNLSSNRLHEFPLEICRLTSLKKLLLTSNALTDVPKQFSALMGLENLNLSGNALKHVPSAICELINLKTLQLGANRISEVPVEMIALQKLEVLYLGGNQIQSIPVEFGEMQSLCSLTLCDNRLTSIPVELVKLKNLQSLSLHNNQLLYLPKEILELVNLVELSLRGNPMVIRFVQDLLCDPPSLTELASRAIKIHKIAYHALPRRLVDHLNTAKKCPNAECEGVYFNSQYHQIKFVDFCGKYRLPLMQYLCSPKCISYSSSASSASSEAESEEDLGEVNQPLMRRVLLG